MEHVLFLNMIVSPSGLLPFTENCRCHCFHHICVSCVHTPVRLSCTFVSVVRHNVVEALNAFEYLHALIQNKICSLNS